MLLLSIPALVACGCRIGTEGTEPGEAVVVEVIDGDTVVIDIAGRSETVRLLGLDAPESVHPSVPVQCFGPEASARLAQLLPTGSAVRPSRDIELRDRYDRLLLYLHRSSDGLFVNEAMVADGFADAAVYEPNTAYYGLLRSARDRARTREVGLWGGCDGPDQPAR